MNRSNLRFRAREYLFSSGVVGKYPPCLEVRSSSRRCVACFSSMLRCVDRYLGIFSSIQSLVGHNNSVQTRENIELWNLSQDLHGKWSFISLPYTYNLCGDHVLMTVGMHHVDRPRCRSTCGDAQTWQFLLIKIVSFGKDYKQSAYMSDDIFSKAYPK